MLRAEKYLGRVGAGVTSPRLFRATDGSVYVVKLQQNRLGPKVLANEYIGCWFGRRLELCFPPGGIIEIGSDKPKGNQLHFASRYLPHSRYVTARNLPGADNKPAMAGVILFDHLFHNIDRSKNRRNLLLCREGSERLLYAIDNSHLFVRGRWNCRTLQQLADSIDLNRRRAYGWLLRHCLRPGDFVPYVKKLADITAAELAALTAEIPEAWLKCKEERQALQEYMLKRCRMAEEIAACLLPLLADQNRCSQGN